MKRLKPIRIGAMLLVMLLACLFAPSAALAATGHSNDNHTDTDDYCLRAHDVTVQLSEFSTKSRSQLESDIISASAFAFLYRSNWATVTSGYSVDFSSLTNQATSSGYPVTVTLPAITMSAPTQITFRVFVSDDSHSVSYFFVSNTSGMSLPPDVLTQQPATASAAEGAEITPGASFHTVRDGAGVWSFAGWSPASQTVGTSDLSFYGGWVWNALPVYSVTYRFTSATSGKMLPSHVMSSLPSDTTGVNGDVFTVQSSYHSVRADGGYWRFSGWNATSQTINDSAIAFTGSWRWRANSTSGTNTPEPTSSITPATETPLPTVTPTVAPETPAPTLPQILVLEQTNENTTPGANAANGGAGSGGGAGASIVAAQAAIAAALGTIVATQTVAMAGDIKVLNWYKLKKAAARRAKL